MSSYSRFTVETPVASFTVTIQNGAVIRIGLNERAHRTAACALERHVATELEEYAAGARTEFTFPVAPGGTAFDRRVWEAVAEIPYGETRTYGEIARAIGTPGGARAVGTANGRNPIPPVIPCHRVVAVGGKLGGYGGGLDLKRRLLNLETVARARRPLGILGVFLAALLSAGACAEPSRPVFVPVEDLPDTSPPSIEFLAPPADDSIFVADTTIRVVTRISDRSIVRSVAASVVGAVFLEFSTELPMDTVVTIHYPIPVGVDVSGRCQLVVVAFDTLFNRAQAVRPFVIIQ